MFQVSVWGFMVTPYSILRCNIFKYKQNSYYEYYLYSTLSAECYLAFFSIDLFNIKKKNRKKKKEMLIEGTKDERAEILLSKKRV